ncbi:anti-sigma factor antagonist [Actinoplanes sp. NPDC026623]|jgi:anti-sigma B factor antagonist|uniref:anti-sigma factor antagonist n=1 Tax=Actinoplanes sp. NPDC026623 TaxID=3155610 RepID=UPI0033D6F22B
MEIGKRQAGDTLILSLSGDLDGRIAPETQREILEALPPGGQVLLDLGGLGLVTSAGLRTMLQIYRRAQIVDTNVTLVGLSTQLRNILTATGFLSFFTVDESVEQCLVRLGEPVGQRGGAE